MRSARFASWRNDLRSQGGFPLSRNFSVRTHWLLSSALNDIKKIISFSVASTLAIALLEINW